MVGDFCWISLQFSDEFFCFSVEVRWYFVFYMVGKFSGFLWISFCVSSEFFVLCGFFCLVCFFCILLSIDFRWDFEWCIFLVQLFVGQGNFSVVQWCIVGVVGIGFVWGIEIDDGFVYQQGRFVSYCVCFFYCVFDRCCVMIVDVVNNVLVVSFEMYCGVVGELVFNVIIDRNIVVIVECNQFIQFQCICQRVNFVGDVFYYVVVVYEGVGVVVDNVVVWMVKLCCQCFFCNCYIDCVGNILIQWIGGGFYISGVIYFWVIWSFRVQLMEVFQFFYWQIVIGEVQQVVDQYGVVVVGQYEVVMVSLGWILWVVFQEIMLQDFGNVSYIYRGIWVIGFGFLYCVYVQCMNSIGKFFM